MHEGILIQEFRSRGGWRELRFMQGGSYGRIANGWRPTKHTGRNCNGRPGDVIGQGRLRPDASAENPWIVSAIAIYTSYGSGVIDIPSLVFRLVRSVGFRFLTKRFHAQSAAHATTSTPAISPFFIVTNVDKTIAFYRDQLGFEVTFQQPDQNPFFAIILRDGAQIFLKSEKDIAPLPNSKRHPSLRWDAYVYAPDPDALALEFADRFADGSAAFSCRSDR